MTRAIIFDCDGVLVDSEILALEVEQAACAELGLHYDLSDYKTRFMGMTTQAFIDGISADYRALKGEDVPAGFLERCYAEYRARLRHLKEVHGASDVIGRLHHLKAVASSSKADALEEKLRRTALWDHFAPHVYSTDLVLSGKPAPDIFLHAAKMIGVPPSDCLVLEDSVNGVRAARAAGMRVWGFLGGGHMDKDSSARLCAEGVERTVDHWHQFATLVESSEISA